MADTKKVQEAQELLNVDELTTKEEEFDLIEGFLKAVENVEQTIKTIRIERDGKLFFAFHIHPISAEDMRTAQKVATSYIPDPRSKKLPKIEKDRDRVAYESYLIYLATTDEDKAKLWDNADLKKKFNVLENYRLIDKALLPGEKDSIIDVINSISGYDGNSIDGELDDIEIAKNS